MHETIDTLHDDDLDDEALDRMNRGKTSVGGLSNQPYSVGGLSNTCVGGCG
ncbi:MAG: hypothetical protein HOH66_08035 [Rhodospirillaceae bacterium]|jgi:hypothetical protein|nr:hypothetical protein [Rhodospirillaceae bacterium]MBT6117803.1 hypothetical protein [Rhodospirillaceae bacterium]